MISMRMSGAAALALVLGACGGGGESPPVDEATESPASPVAGPSEAPSPDAASTDGETPAPAPSASASAAAVAAAATPPASFNQCKVCHAVEPGKHGIGPSLAGIYGTKAGDIAGFEFSSAMKDSGLTWDAATLDKYLTDPRALVPGTKMSFGGLKDEAKRKEIIDYLRSL